MLKYCCAGVAVLAGVSSATAYDLFTDDVAFEAMLVPGFYLEEFDGYTYGSFTDEFLILESNGWRYTIDEDGTGSSGLWSGDGNMSTNSALNYLTVTFDETADKGLPTAVGGWFFPSEINGFYIPGPMDLTIWYDDGTSDTYSWDTANDTDFRGFGGTKPIAEFWIDAPEVGENAWPTMDHFYVGEYVPAPGALALLGLAGLAGRRRR
jgi:hypothetical protein